MIASIPAIVLASALAAQGPLTLGDVFAAVDRHPSLAAAELDTEVARGEQLAAEGAFDPTLRARAFGEWGYETNAVGEVWVEQPTTLWGAAVHGGWRIGAGEFPVYEGDKITGPWGEARAGVSVPLLRNGVTDGRRASIERAALEQRAAEHALTAQRLALRRAAALRYLEWAAHGARLVVAEELLGIARERDAQLRERALAGDVAEVERIDNQRSVSQRESRVVAARRALEQSALELSLHLRGPDGAPRVPRRDEVPPWSVGELPLPDVATNRAAVGRLEERALEARPELRRLRTQREQAAVDVGLAQNQVLPALDVVAQVKQDLGVGGQAIGVAPEVIGGVVLNVPLPLRVARGRLAVAEAQRARVDEVLRFAEDRVRAEVADAVSAIEAARERRDAARREAAAAAEVEAGERERLRAGDSTILLVNLREQATADARLAAVDAALDEQRGLVAALAATTQLLELP